MRFACLLLALAAAVPAAAADQAPYYGPMKGWMGLSSGVSDAIAKDGSWRISAVTRRGHAIDLAVYRAAEMAEAAGYPYVEMLAGYQTNGAGRNAALVYARPSRSPAAPAACRSPRRNTCYTADVAEAMRRLGGPTGTTPGVPVADHVDRFGQSVYRGGFGAGRVSGEPLPTSAVLVPVAAVPAPSPFHGRLAAFDPADEAAQAAADRYDHALRAARPVSADPRLGWSARD